MNEDQIPDSKKEIPQLVCRAAMQEVSLLQDLLIHSTINNKKLTEVVELQMKCIVSFLNDYPDKITYLEQLQELIDKMLDKQKPKPTVCEEWLKKEQGLEEGE